MENIYGDCVAFKFYKYLEKVGGIHNFQIMVSVKDPRIPIDVLKFYKDLHNQTCKAFDQIKDAIVTDVLKDLFSGF